MAKKNPLLIILAVSTFFFMVFMAVAISTVMSLTGGNRNHRRLFSSRPNSIGVIELKGVITDSKKTLEDIDSLAEDPLVKGILLRINSPGGAVAPSQEIYEALKSLSKKKPVYASMSSLAASGGYYIACGAKKIYANPGTITGSIGVIMEFADTSKLMQWAKVSPFNIKTGKFKDIGNPAREMRDDEKALLQDMVDNVLGQFRRAVASARNLPMDKVVEISDGRIFSGEQAKEAKLVDELGGMNDAVEALAKEVGIEGKPRLVYPAKKHRGLGLERFFVDGGDDEDDSISRLGGSLFSNVVGALLGTSRDVVSGASSVAKLAGPLFLLPFSDH